MHFYLHFVFPLPSFFLSLYVRVHIYLPLSLSLSLSMIEYFYFYLFLSLYSDFLFPPSSLPLFLSFSSFVFLLPYFPCTALLRRAPIHSLAFSRVVRLARARATSCTPRSLFPGILPRTFYSLARVSFMALPSFSDSRGKRALSLRLAEPRHLVIVPRIYEPSRVESSTAVCARRRRTGVWEEARAREGRTEESANRERGSLERQGWIKRVT